jgi:hypothetical protein
MKYVVIGNADNGKPNVVASETDPDSAKCKAQELAIQEDKPYSVYECLGVMRPIKSAKWEGD